MFDHFVSRPLLPLGGMLLVAGCLLAACGGGGEVDGSGGAESAVATSYTEGQVTGYGSIVVNGVRFDDRNALVTDDEDRAGRRADVKVGMWVEIEGADVDRDRRVGRAIRVRWANEFVGPVTAVDTAAGTFVLFGQTIQVKDATQFEGFAAGLADVQVAQVVEVHGFFNAATGLYVATRVESAGDATSYKLRGIVSELDTAGKSFKLGTETIDYSTADASDLVLADGLRVRVRLQTTKNIDGKWVATSVKHGVSRPVGDRIESEIEGSVTAFDSATSFEVNGVPVDATTAIFRDGPVRLGDSVEVKGKVENGVLKAVLVKKQGNDDSITDRNEMHGTVASVNTADETFVLRHEVHGDLPVSYDHIVAFEGGTLADLVTGATVEVHGRLMLGGVLQAVRVKFED